MAGMTSLALGTKLGIDPIKLLQMINANVVPTKAVLVGLAKESGSNLDHPQNLAAETKPYGSLYGKNLILQGIQRIRRLLNPNPARSLW
jgi:hypothetical protein